MSRAEVIVVDGGSADDTARLAAPLADRLVHSARGRAQQMNAGAAVAGGDVLLFLHADTSLPDHACELVLDGLSTSDCAWGRFTVAQGRCCVNEFSLAFNWNCHRRPGDVREADRIFYGRWISSTVIDGRYRNVEMPQATRSAALSEGEPEDLVHVPKEWLE